MPYYRLPRSHVVIFSPVVRPDLEEFNEESLDVVELGERVAEELAEVDSEEE